MDQPAPPPAAPDDPAAPEFDAPDPDALDHSAMIAEVPADLRQDGWTAERRIAFIDAIWEGASVAEAARLVGMTPQTARRLRRRAPAFAAAWDEAQAFIVGMLADTAFERAMHGTRQPIFQRGQIVGFRPVHHDNLLMRLLALRDPEHYAPIGERERWFRLREAMAAKIDGLRETGSG